ncbi:MAG: hypothetical protein JOZ75_02385 [Candidatus Dormibacteraeota bacterium]|nr:hypothetical protein [Candidatus Dormibacteraeota bacterium]
MSNPRAKWIVSALIVVIGIGYLVAASVGGKVQLGLEMLGIAIVIALVLLLFGGRSETIRGWRGDERDERFALIDLRATAFTGFVMAVVIIGAYIYELARGRSGEPYLWLGTIAGVTYIVSIAVLRLRG